MPKFSDLRVSEPEFVPAAPLSLEVRDGVPQSESTPVMERLWVDFWELLDRDLLLGRRPECCLLFLDLDDGRPDESRPLAPPLAAYENKVICPEFLRVLCCEMRRGTAIAVFLAKSFMSRPLNDLYCYW